MGYESRIYVVRRYADLDGGCAYNEHIATFNLCCMGNKEINGKTFRELFTAPLTGRLYAEGGETLITEDAYGAPIMGTDVDTLWQWLSAFICKEPYWRADALAAFLESVVMFNVENIYCYHYGY